MIFEFIVAAVVFFGIVFYVINYLNLQMSTYGNDYFTNELESKAAQIAEFLLHNPGVFDEANNPVTLGLSDGWPVLSTAKIDTLNEYCSDHYQDFLEMLDLETSFPYSKRMMRTAIVITEVAKERALMDCGIEPEDRTVVRVSRFGVTELGNVVSVTVSVWL